MTTLFLKSEGQPLRTAMKDAGLSGPKLAAMTRALDPKGKGVSPAAIGRLTGQGKTSRDRARHRTARLIAEALNAPLEGLFLMPSVSTDTVERSTPHGDADPR